MQKSTRQAQNPARSESHRASQSRTRPQIPALPRSHTPSQSRTKPKPQPLLHVAKRHTVAPGPNPSAFWESQSITMSHHKVAPGRSPSASSDSRSVAKSHVARALAPSACRNASRSRIRPKPQRTLSVAKRHKVTPCPQP